VGGFGATPARIEETPWRASASLVMLALPTGFHDDASRTSRASDARPGVARFWGAFRCGLPSRTQWQHQKLSWRLAINLGAGGGIDATLANQSPEFAGTVAPADLHAVDDVPVGPVRAVGPARTGEGRAWQLLYYAADSPRDPEER
jgi:hypothetical protein